MLTSAISKPHSALSTASLYIKIKEGEKIDDSELLIQLNLAHSYLLNSDFNSAKSIYKKYQAQNVSDSIAWIDKVKLDFETLKTAGLPSNDFNRILKLLGEKH